MKFDASIPPSSLIDIPEIVRQAERLGFDAIWSNETQHAPFLPLALAAEHSRHMQFGTAVAIAFARSPATLAYQAWDLAQASGGRLILGLGTQIRPHIERRFGMPWPASPVGKLRELIGVLRSFWRTWQTGERLNFRGQYYKITLMSPFFNPGPIDHPEIPIYLAGVNVGLAQLAGEVADGFHIHPYHSVRYLQEVVQPAIAEGAVRQGRDPKEVSRSVSAMVAIDQSEREFVRSQIAFYASTPTYRPVMELHGWGEVADWLRELSRQGKWSEMGEMVNEEMLDTYATIAPADGLARALKDRYRGIADRLTLYLPYRPGLRDDFWRNLVEELRRDG